MKYEILNPDLLAKLEDPEERKQWLVLEPHEDYPGQWHVESFDSDFYFNLSEEVGPYRIVAPNRIEDFYEAARECEYKLAFTEDPVTILSAYEHLNDEPSVEIISPFDDTVKGFLPYQVQGFNFLRKLDGGVVMWSTGTGKTVCASALLKDAQQRNAYDTAFFVVKGHNRINTQRTLKRLVDIDSIVLEHYKPEKRRELYEQVLNATEPQVVITNYEKFRVDFDEMVELFEDRRIFVVWDEMPMKLKNRNTKLYHAVCNCLYDIDDPPKVSWKRRRPSELKQFMLSATPIEVDPEDWFNCVRLIDPRVYGSTTKFHNEYVSSYDPWDRGKPASWKHLDRMGLKASHIVHQVDKSDPDIAAMFPKVISEPYFIDWDPSDRKLYDSMVDFAHANIEEIGPLAAVTVLQMFCCAPTMLLSSANVFEAYELALADWLENGGKEPPRKGSEAAMRMVETIQDQITDKRHTKLDTLRSLITEVHPNEKICVFSSYNDRLLPIIERCLREWGVTYVRYGGTANQRQAAEDAFKHDPSIQVFLSSDAGSDSINLEVGSVVIHYDLPWNWSTYTQRENRIHRVTSTFKAVRFYTLLMVDSVEDRRLELVLQKMDYHDGVFKGAISDFNVSARMTKSDLLYVCGR